MNLLKNLPKKFSDLWCGVRKRPSAFITISVGPLRVAFLLNILNNSYEQFKK